MLCSHRDQPFDMTCFAHARNPNEIGNIVFTILRSKFGARIQGAFIMSGGQMSNEIFLSKEKERFIGRVSQTAMKYIASLI